MSLRKKDFLAGMSMMPKKSILLALIVFSSGCGVEDGVSLIDSPSSACEGGTALPGTGTGLENGRYSRYQTFDVQRSPAFPTAGKSFSISHFAVPRKDSAGFPSYSMTDEEYVTFFYAGGDLTQNGKTGCNVGILWHKADSSTELIAAGGTVWGISKDGFFHNSQTVNAGTFVSANLGMAYGNSLSYTPAGDIASCADLAAYVVSTTPLNTGEAAPSCDE
ncbi:MAG: hypothetical protein KF789_15145 [Bdellovibrionaceae bacterium]|nr:hypothetical protein [Pseudobdellovibrionaceae bacterium]